MKSRVHIKFGLATAAALMLLTLVFYLGRMEAGRIQPLIGILVIMAGVMISCFAFKKTFPETPFNEIFFNGFRTTAIIAVMMAVFAAVFILAFPGFKDQAIDLFRQKEITQAEADKVLLAKVDGNVSEYKRRFFTMFIGSNMMIVVLAGLAGSLAGAFLSKNRMP